MCLPQLKHDWKRFVIPSKTQIKLEREFLPDPEDEYGQYANTAAQAFSGLRARSLVVLLGDSGLGKSDVFAQEVAAIDDAGDAEHTAILCRVSDYIDTLQIQSFFNSAPFQQWLGGTGTLSLFLDGLDEGLLRGDHWPTSIRMQIERCATSGQHGEQMENPSQRVLERLRLRISCRPGLWPASLSDNLRSLYPGIGLDSDYIVQWDLLPLREADVRTAAMEHGLDPDRFMEDVTTAGAFSFAASPLSLRLLFQIEAVEQRLPHTHVSMFQKGCTHLAEEHNPLRRESALRPRIAVQRRLVVARRIAAMSVFCAKTRVSRSAAASPATETSVLSPSDIRGSSSQEDISPEELAETLDSGLFTFHDNETVRWAHASFSAFLAAEWCNSLGLTVAELEQLVTAVTGVHVGIPDQVVSTAAWLCELEPSLQKLLLRKNPYLLLSLDSNAIDEQAKPLAVKTLIEQEAPLHASRELIRTGAQLCHPEVAKQVRPYLTSRRNSETEKRRRALDIATSCRLHELSTELSKLAFDRKEDRSLRSSAAYAISVFGSVEARRALLPLALEGEADDSQDLKGWALSANWPGGLTSRQLFALFSDPINPHFHGGYEAFLYQFGSHLAETLADDDLIHALEWAEALPVFGHNLAFDRLIYSIVLRACDSYHNQTVLKLLAELLVSSTARHGEAIPRQANTHGPTGWEAKLAEFPDLRERLIRECFRVAVDGDRAALYRLGWFFRLSVNDIQLLRALTHEDPLTFGQPVGQVLLMLGQSPAVYEAIYSGVQEGILEEDLLQNLHVELGSMTAEMQRDDYERPFLVEAAKIRRLQEGWYSFSYGLDLARDRKSNGWIYMWESLWNLSPEKDSRWEGNPDLKSAAGWSQLDEAIREQVLNAACGFALSQSRLPLDFLNGGAFSRFVVYVYSALLICIETHEDRLRKVDDATWNLWVAITFWFPFGQSEAAWHRIVGWLLEVREDAFFAGLQLYINASLDAQQSISYSVRRFRDWPARTELVIREALRRKNLTGDQWAALMEWGFDVNAPSFEAILLRCSLRNSLSRN